MARASVFNVLDDFTSAGIVTAASADPGAARYELSDVRHGHFVCRIYGTIQDVRRTIAVEDLVLDTDAGRAEDTHVVYCGSCPDCLDRTTSWGRASVCGESTDRHYDRIMNVHIRPARAADLVRINEIYDHTVVDSHISFDLEPWDLERRTEWWTHYGDTGPYRVFVAEVDGYVVGIAYSSQFREKAAYRSSVETTVVVDPGFRASGIGRRLLVAVLDTVQTEGVHRAYAVVTLPNEASIGIHEALGYRLVGTLDEVGFKAGTYWTTAILEKRLDEDGE